MAKASAQPDTRPARRKPGEPLADPMAEAVARMIADAAVRRWRERATAPARLTPTDQSR